MFYKNICFFYTLAYFAPYLPFICLINYTISLKMVEDLSRLNKTEELYTNEDWFKVLKSRWSNYYDTLEKYWIKMYFRSDEQGDNIYQRRYEHFPEYYR